MTARKKSSLALIISLLPERTWTRDTESVWRESYSRKEMCSKTPHLEFPPGVKLLQALHGLLPVHHGGYSGPLLQTEGETIRGLTEVGGGRFTAARACRTRTQIQGCLRASAAVMRLLGLMVSILLMRSLASGVTVSHSGDGNCQGETQTRDVFRKVN